MKHITAFSRRFRRRALLLLAILWSAAFAGQTMACSVCFGESDSPFVKGTEASVLFMVILTYLMIVGGIGVFILLRRRAARRLAEADSHA